VVGVVERPAVPAAVAVLGDAAVMVMAVVEIVATYGSHAPHISGHVAVAKCWTSSSRDSQYSGGMPTGKGLPQSGDSVVPLLHVPAVWLRQTLQVAGQRAKSSLCA